MKKINGMRLDAVLFTSTVLLFFLWPQLDLLVASVFFNLDSKMFVGMEAFWVLFIHTITAYIHWPILVGLVLGIVFFALRQQKHRKMRCVYLLCCLLVGPGLIVNAWLKDNSIGRARPKQVQEFGGEHQFTPPFVYSGACERNCSFTSGHASIGFLIASLFWVTRKRHFFYLGLGVGGMLGVMRIAMGGHFLSDVIFSFWVVYFSSLWLNQFFSMKMHEIPIDYDSDDDFSGEPSRGG